jgi:hypothetical protein
MSSLMKVWNVLEAEGIPLEVTAVASYRTSGLSCQQAETTAV